MSVLMPTRHKTGGDEDIAALLRVVFPLIESGCCDTGFSWEDRQRSGYASTASFRTRG